MKMKQMEPLLMYRWPGSTHIKIYLGEVAPSSLKWIARMLSSDDFGLSIRSNMWGMSGKSVTDSISLVKDVLIGGRDQLGWCRIESLAPHIFFVKKVARSLQWFRDRLVPGLCVHPCSGIFIHIVMTGSGHRAIGDPSLATAPLTPEILERRRVTPSIHIAFHMISPAKRCSWLWQVLWLSPVPWPSQLLYELRVFGNCSDTALLSGSFCLT